VSAANDVSGGGLLQQSDLPRTAVRYPQPGAVADAKHRRSFKELRPKAAYATLPTRGRDRKNQFCSLTPSITTVEAELASGTLELRMSRRSVPLSQKLRVIL
jgi:hypothetical protein